MELEGLEEPALLVLDRAFVFSLLEEFFGAGGFERPGRRPLTALETMLARKFADRFLAAFIPGMREGDLLMITADHGCDPSYTKTTDHTREYVPYLVCGKGVKPGVDLGTRLCFGTIAQAGCEYLGVDASCLDGHSVLQEILK